MWMTAQDLSNDSLLKKLGIKNMPKKMAEYGQRKEAFKKNSHLHKKQNKLSDKKYHFTGARNPFAIVLRKYNSQVLKKNPNAIKLKPNEKIDPNKPQLIPDVRTLASRISRGDIASFLNKPVQLAGDKHPFPALTYDKLFDPAFRSPLFNYGSGIPADKSSTGTAGNKDIITEAVNPAYGDCQTLLDHCGNYNSPLCNAAFNLSVTDPVQGPYPDCWLIAALSALCWRSTWPVIFSFLLQSVFVGDMDENVYWEDFANAFPLDKNGKLIGANTPASETWPFQFEYALANFLNTPLNNQGYLDLCQMDSGSPMYALMSLEITTNSVQEMMSQAFNDPNFADTVWANLTTDAGFCYTPGNGSGFNTVTQHPTVAWTYRSGDPKVTGSSQDGSLDIAPSGSGIWYDDIVVGQHSYTLLGTVTRQNPAVVTHKVVDRFVVLRNPWGLEAVSPSPLSKVVQDSGGKQYRVLLDTPQTLCMDPDNVANPLYLNTQGAGCMNHGIFAIQVEDFVKWFAGYGYIPAA